MGKPASAFKWDPVKGKYCFEGESDSEPEVVAPPPKTKAKPVDEDKPKAEEAKEVTGANAFATVAFGGALAGRRRDRGGGGARPGGGSAPKRPMTPFVPTTPATTEENKEEEASKVVKTEPDQPNLPSTAVEPDPSSADVQETATTMIDTTLNGSLYKSAIEDSLD